MFNKLKKNQHCTLKNVICLPFSADGTVDVRTLVYVHVVWLNPSVRLPILLYVDNWVNIIVKDCWVRFYHRVLNVLFENDIY